MQNKRKCPQRGHCWGKGTRTIRRNISVVLTASSEFLQISYPAVSFFKKKKEKIASDLSVPAHQRPSEENLGKGKNRSEEMNDSVRGRHMLDKPKLSIQLKATMMELEDAGHV